MNDAYVEGFIQKCAEMGVDPEELLKAAGGMGSLLGRAAEAAKDVKSVAAARGGSFMDQAATGVGAATGKIKSMPGTKDLKSSFMSGYRSEVPDEGSKIPWKAILAALGITGAAGAGGAALAMGGNDAEE